MAKGKVTATLAIELTIENIEDVKSAYEKLSEVFSNADIDICDNDISIYDKEISDYTYYPAVYTLSNGDPGYPEEYEDELTYGDRDDVIYEVKNALSGIDYEICSLDYDLEYDDENIYVY